MTTRATPPMTPPAMGPAGDACGGGGGVVEVAPILVHWVCGQWSQDLLVRVQSSSDAQVGHDGRVLGQSTQRRKRRGVDISIPTTHCQQRQH